MVKAKSNMNAVFTKSKNYNDEGRVMTTDQDRCVCSFAARWAGCCILRHSCLPAAHAWHRGSTCLLAPFKDLPNRLNVQGSFTQHSARCLCEEDPFSVRES